MTSQILVNAQKKIMSPKTYDIWNKIEKVQISNNGDWITYVLKPGRGDQTLYLYNTRDYSSVSFDRGHDARFDTDNLFMAYKVGPAFDTIQTLKRQKKKKEDFPKDTLIIYSLVDQVIESIPDIKEYKLPEEQGGMIAVRLNDRDNKKDTTLIKKEDSNNGGLLMVRDYHRDTLYQFSYTKDYMWTESANKMLVHGLGPDTTNHPSVVLFDFDLRQSDTLYNEEGKYSKFSLSKEGDAVGFLADRDTTKEKVRPMELFLWKKDKGMAKPIAHPKSSFLPKDWMINHASDIVFSDNGERLYFGIRPMPPEEDTMTIEEDKAVVEVWNYKDPLLYTQQNVNAKRESERSYAVLYDMATGRFHQISDLADSEFSLDTKHTSRYLLTYDEKPYQQYLSWEGYIFRDIYLSDIKTGKKKKVLSKVQGFPRMSPSEKYIYWYDRVDTSWVTYEVTTGIKKAVTQGSFYDELNDRPMPPYPSGFLHWIDDDRWMLIYDHYDVWKVDPTGQKESINVTQGRQANMRYRYVRLDDDIRQLPWDTTILLKSFDDINKTSGYASLHLGTNIVKSIEHGPYNYTTRITKAKESDDIIFTKQNFQTFPNLIHASKDFDSQKVVTDANPQQSEYRWGNIELVEWEDYNGNMVKGLLLKPDDFDPAKKYPMIVNFYEKSSNRLYNHSAPEPHRSTINYSYYVNKGYIIFNPDIKYQNGYPGQSCYDAVMSGVEAMIDKGYIDKERIGVQGHSWGGYQIAHLVTKTDMFRCAEAGAPVVNMVSAYGGIRWRTGMSRMFQYERTQSRLGATLWEKPELYLENSPIFNVDKINTPVLILHNDKDGAVPWYQGIEFFVAMRRLGKPAWLLNYNEEPHWPIKRPNRIDFNIRMEQFFDHYLMDKPMPEWMSKGVPAVQKGYNYGLEMTRE